MLNKGQTHLTNRSASEPVPGSALLYQIRIEGHLDEQWADWFGGPTISHEEDGNTLLTALVTDQAALYGLLKKIRNLGIPLISVHRVNAIQCATAQPEDPS